MNRLFISLAVAVLLGLIALAGLGVGMARKGDSREKFLLGIALGLEPGRARVAAEAGAGAMRSDVPWAAVERTPGIFVRPPGVKAAFDELRRLGIAPVGILDYGNSFYDGGLFPRSEPARAAFARYALFTVGAFGTQARWWEIWNEWNLPVGMPAGVGPGSPEDYVKLLAAAYGPLKRENPYNVFIGGAVAGIGRKDDWTRRALDAGLLRHLDAFSFHPYVYWMPPEERLPERGLMALTAELEALLARYPGGDAVPLYVTEVGWPTHEGRDGVTLQQQADYTARALLLLRADPRIRGVWVYTLADGVGPETDREAHFGLTFSGGSPKPAWFAFRDTAGLLAGVHDCRRLDFGDDADEVAGVEVREASGRRSLVLWAIEEGTSADVAVFTNLSPMLHAAVKTRLIGRGRGPALAFHRMTDGQYMTNITLSSTPLVLEDVGAGIRVEVMDIY